MIRHLDPDSYNPRFRELVTHVGHDVRIVSTTVVDIEDGPRRHYVTVDCRDCRVILEQVDQLRPRRSAMRRWVAIVKRVWRPYVCRI